MDRFSRYGKTAAALLGAAALGNGAWMYLAPQAWFIVIPGVLDSGPFNAHLVRDVGAAYVAQGLALTLPARAWSLYLVAAAFGGLHALLHVWEVACGWAGAEHLWMDLLGVLLPGVLTMMLAVATMRANGKEA